MTSLEHLQLQRTLIELERQADLEQYRQKVLLRSLTQRTKEGTTWYPVRLKREYIGTGERLIIEIEKTNYPDQPHSFQSGKLVNIFSNASGKPDRDHIGGVINYVRDNQMVITLNGDELPEWIDQSQLGVDVMFDEMSYREMDIALRAMIKAEGRTGELREIILGTGKIARRELVENPPAVFLNDSQHKALLNVLTSRDVALIHGPPGTGKTTTLVRAIVDTIHEERQVLVCASSNAAVDLLVEKLDEQGISVIRIGHPARVTENSLSKTLDVKIAAHPNFDELKMLRKQMEKVRSQAFKFKRNFGHHEREQRRLLKEEAKLLKSDADLLEFHIVNDLLQNSQAICCTLVGASHPVMRNRKFKTAFIDEAGQALEPACWIPVLRSSRLILAGDHQQLPPTVRSREAAQQGLTKTMFEKVIEFHPASSALLEIQYRMHEDIMKFSSHHFYHDRLVAHESVRHWLIDPQQVPVEFIDTAGCGYAEFQDPETLSRSNAQEAALLISRIEKLVGQIGTDKWTDQKISLGVISPYRAQVDELKKLIDASGIIDPLKKFITVNTVDAFQGQERDVIAISFVRSNDAGDTGFLGDIRRTNVAMTRARKKLIMTGDSATLASHPFYIELLDFVQENNFYTSAFEIQ